MGSNWTQDETKGLSGRVQDGILKDPRRIQEEAKRVSRGVQDGPIIDPIGSKNEPRWFLDGSKVDPSTTQDEYMKGAAYQSAL